MIPRFRQPLAIFLGCLVSLMGADRLVAQTPPTPTPPDVRQLLQRLAGYSSDPCGGAPAKKEGDWRVADDLAHRLFSRAADSVAEALNANPADSALPRERATAALQQVEQMSAEINAEWPQDSRFHFQVLDLSPMLVVKLSIRFQEDFFAFGVPKEISRNPNSSWRILGSNPGATEFTGPPSEIDLYPIHRGPSGDPRFLVKAIYSGCAGSIGVVYSAYKWNPRDIDLLDGIISQEGAFGLDDNVEGFPQIGKLKTDGPLITLPYCQFSPIDTWDNPSLCAVDTYDLSGDEVKFSSRTYNRPDLVPVAKAIEFAEKRDYHAVLGYCASPEIARRMVRVLPSDVFAGELQVSKHGDGRERVVLGDSPKYRFDVEKRGDRWIVVGFATE